MMESEHVPAAQEETLGAFLAQRARGSSAGWLAADVAVGVAAAAALALWQPGGWPIGIALGVCEACYGLWGLADRGATDAPSGSARHRVLTAAQALAAGLGGAAALAALAGVLFLALGTIIS